MKITIGIPAYNEEKNISLVITQLKKITDSIIVCDDGSSDLTGEIARNLGAVVIRHSKNMGYGTAINSIFKKCSEMNTDILVTFDADGQHRVEDVNKIIEPVKQGNADIVIGSRFLDNISDVPNFRKLGIKIITQVTNASIKKKLTDSQSGLRAYNKQVLTWSLSKDKLEIEKMNEKSVLFAEKTFPQIRMKIYNFVEFGKES